MYKYNQEIKSINYKSDRTIKGKEKKDSLLYGTNWEKATAHK